MTSRVLSASLCSVLSCGLFSAVVLAASPRAEAAAARSPEQRYRAAITRNMKANRWLAENGSVGNLAVVSDGRREATVMFEIRKGGEVSDLDTFVIDKASNRAYRNGDGYSAAMKVALARATRDYGAEVRVVAAGISPDGQHVIARVYGAPAGIAAHYEVAVDGGFRVAQHIETKVAVPVERPMPAFDAKALSPEARQALRRLLKAAGM